MLRKENEAFRQANRLLRSQLNFELDTVRSKSRDDFASQIRDLEQKIGSLRTQIQDRERQNRRLHEQVDEKR